MENDTYLIQRFLQFQRDIGYAYFTDMDKSTLEAPLNYSLSRYEFSETKEGQTIVRISVVYQSSSRLLAYFVRRAFSSSLRRDFERAAATIELITKTILNSLRPCRSESMIKTPKSLLKVFHGTKVL